MKLTEKISRIKSTFELLQVSNWEAVLNDLNPEECASVSESSIPECKSCEVSRPHIGRAWFEIKFTFRNGVVKAISKGVNLQAWQKSNPD